LAPGCFFEVRLFFQLLSSLLFFFWLAFPPLTRLPFLQLVPNWDESSPHPVLFALFLFFSRAPVYVFSPALNPILLDLTPSPELSDLSAIFFSL